MADRGVDLGTIGLLALAGLPYTLKFLWAPVVDAWQVPYLSRRLGRRRGWLVASQLVLMATIVFLGTRDPLCAPLMVGLAALLVAFASATQDIVVDAFRVQSLPDRRAGRRNGELRGRLPHRHAGLRRRRDRVQRVARGARPEQGGDLADRLCGGGAPRAGRARRPRCLRASRHVSAKSDPEPGAGAARAPLRHGQGRFLRVPAARRRARHARLRRALQAVRRARRHDDRAVRPVARLQQGGSTRRS